MFTYFFFPLHNDCTATQHREAWFQFQLMMMMMLAHRCRMFPSTVRRKPFFLHVFFVSSMQSSVVLTCLWSDWSASACRNEASYTAGFKLKAVEYSLENGNRASERHFSVDEVGINYWRRQHEKLKATSKTHYTVPYPLK